MRNNIKQNIKNTIAEYPRGFWMLMGINFINFLGNNLIFPFFALYISKKFGASMTQVGLLFTFFTISGFIGSTIGGAMTDRFGRKSMLIFNLITSALFNLAIGLCTIAFFLLWRCPDRWDHRFCRRTGRSGDDRRPGARRKARRGIWASSGWSSIRQWRSVLPSAVWLPHTPSWRLFIADAVISSICAFLVYLVSERNQTRSQAWPGQGITGDHLRRLPGRSQGQRLI